MLQWIVSRSSREVADENSRHTDSAVCAGPCAASVWTTVFDQVKAPLQFRGREAISRTIGGAIGSAVRVALWLAT